jgi:RNA polymerase sigma factor (sigma-70 family)
MASAKKQPTLTQADIDAVRDTLSKEGVQGDLDDAVGRTMLSVSRRLDRYDPARPLRPWLIGFARNQALMEHRGKRRLRKHEELTGDVEESAPESCSREDPGDRIALAQRMLNTLPKRERTAFVLREGARMTLGDIAKELGCSTTRAYVLVKQARKRLEALRARLEREGDAQARKLCALPLWLLFAGHDTPPSEIDEPPSAPGMSSPPLRPLLASPWLGLPALAAGAALAYALLSLRACEAPQAAAAPAATAVTVAETATSTQPPAGALPSAAPPSPPATQAAAAPATSAVPAPELGTDEARARLFAIRTALGRGDGGEALALLDRLAQRDRRGTFRQERELLRVEVLARVGRGAEARALLARLRKTMGEDPSLRRVSDVVDKAR